MPHTRQPTKYGESRGGPHGCARLRADRADYENEDERTDDFTEKVGKSVANSGEVQKQARSRSVSE